MLIYLRPFLRTQCRRIKYFNPFHHSQSFRLCSHQKQIETKYYHPLGESKISDYIQKLKNEFENSGTITSVDEFTLQHKNILTGLFEKFDLRKSVLYQLSELTMEMQKEESEEMLKLADDEKQSYYEALLQYDKEICDAILELNEDETANCKSLVLEISAGVGGQEAMLFAGDLYDMYLRFINYKRWELSVLEEGTTDLGGLRHATILVNGSSAYKTLQYEGGVHRVQRSPKTDKYGRLQTSTVVVAVLPQLDDINIQINPKDLRIQATRASGPGGQNVNKAESAIRIFHIPTGITIECQEERSQHQNKALGMKKLYAKLIQRELRQRTAHVKATRKSQIGSGSGLRHEKVRTYNYGQSRITDHRLEGGGGTIYNLSEFMRGNDVLDDFITKIKDFSKKRKLLEIIQKE